MPENVFVLPSHVVHHLLEYSSLKLIFLSKALPLYFLAPTVVDNSDVKISQFFYRQFFCFFFLLKVLNFPLCYFTRTYLSFCFVLFLFISLGNWLALSILGIVSFNSGKFSIMYFFVSSSLFSLFFPLKCLLAIYCIFCLYIQHLLTFLWYFPSFLLGWVSFPDFVSQTTLCFFFFFFLY